MNIYSSIGSIQKVQPFPGGICRIQFIPWEQVLIWPKLNPQKNIIDQYFEFVSDFEVYELVAPDKDRTFKEELKVANEGSYYDQVLTCRLAGFNQENNFNLQAMVGRRFVVFFNDRYGDFKVFGNKDAGAEFTYSYFSGDGSSSRSSLLSFRIESISPAHVIDPLVQPVPSKKYILWGSSNIVYSDGDAFIY